MQVRHTADATLALSILYFRYGDVQCRLDPGLLIFPFSQGDSSVIKLPYGDVRVFYVPPSAEQAGSLPSMVDQTCPLQVIFRRFPADWVQHEYHQRQRAQQQVGREDISQQGFHDGATSGARSSSPRASFRLPHIQIAPTR